MAEAKEKRVTERAAAIQGLRDMADWLERTPDAPMICISQLSAFPADDTDPVAVLKALRGELSEPRRNDYWLFADKCFGPIRYQLSIDLHERHKPKPANHAENAFLRLVQQVTGEANAHLGSEAE